LGLSRQEALIGHKTPGLEECAYRLAKYEASDSRQKWLIQHCGLGFGEWKLSISGWLTGKGTGQTDITGSGKFTVHYTKFDRFSADGTEEGAMRLSCHDPSMKECNGKYGSQPPPTVYLLDAEQISWTGEIHLPKMTVPFPTALPYAPFSFLKKAPVVFKKVDKPCDPKAVEN